MVTRLNESPFFTSEKDSVCFFDRMEAFSVKILDFSKTINTRSLGWFKYSEEGERGYRVKVHRW